MQKILASLTVSFDVDRYFVDHSTSAKILYKIFPKWDLQNLGFGERAFGDRENSLFMVYRKKASFFARHELIGRQRFQVNKIWTVWSQR